MIMQYYIIATIVLYNFCVFVFLHFLSSFLDISQKLEYANSYARDGRLVCTSTRDVGTSRTG